ncbi:MAG: 6-hydroxymethylpterin diphosphokinase MptE-like protein [Desulfurococcaceae archaeon]
MDAELKWLIPRDEWLHIYGHLIKNKLALSFQLDQKSTSILSNILSRKSNSITVETLFEKISNRSLAIVAGCADSIYRDLELLIERTMDPKKRGDILIVSANGATKILLDMGITPDLVTTDLDGDLNALVTASSKGSILAIHAHGDNIDKLANVELFNGPLIGTTQVEPLPFVYNFGGFTDGDRAVHILFHAGYRRIALIGFDFTRVFNCPGEMVKDANTGFSKLEIARYLLKRLIDRGLVLIKPDGGIFDL